MGGLRAEGSTLFAAPAHWVTAYLLVAAAAFNYPLFFWARNAWDISSPSKPLAIAATLALLGLALVWLLTRFGVHPQAAALGVGTVLVLFMHWEEFEGLGLMLWVVAVIAVVGIGHRLRHTRKLDGLVLVVIAVVGVAPLLQVALAHLQNTNPYRVTRSADSHVDATPTGAVEDVMVIVVDGYPSLRLAEEWFGHDTSHLSNELAGLGFEVEAEAWSQHTFTAPSVSALLELQPVIDEGPAAFSENLSSLYAITRGDSFVSRSLQAAGFTYTHFDSGWDVTACGETVDLCVDSPWIDETVAAFVGSTALGDLVERRLDNYTLAATLHTTNGLVGMGKELSQNGTHDYIFAHMLLPHDPPVVNEYCQFEEARVRNDELYLAGEISIDERRQAISDQMTCVDSLLSQIAEVIGPSTAVIITADHGTGTGGQIPLPPSEWTDSDVAERFGILLAYRLPTECDDPGDAINTLVMRAIMTCTVTLELPAEKPGYLIGLAAPEWVEPSRMQDIRARLAERILKPNGSELILLS